MELKHVVVRSRDLEEDARFLEALGLKKLVGGKGWAAFASDGGGPVELIAFDPMEGFEFGVAPGFEVKAIELLRGSLIESGLKTTGLAARPWGKYFFAQDSQGRFWHFYESLT